LTLMCQKACDNIIVTTSVTCSVNKVQSSISHHVTDFSSHYADVTNGFVHSHN